MNSEEPTDHNIEQPDASDSTRHESDTDPHKQLDPEDTKVDVPAERSADPLAELTAERDKLKEQLLRTAADFDNFRKRSRKDFEEADKRAREDVLRDLLPVFDNLERAMTASENAQDVEAIRDGLKMVLKLFEDTAHRFGLERIPTMGNRFDPAVHDAIQQVETSEHPIGTIVSELVPGYRLNGRLIRAAMVAVAKTPSS